MGHNISQDRLDREEITSVVAELHAYLVPGWTIDVRRRAIVPIETVLGALHRRQEVTFRCGRRDCHRRVEVDLRSTAAAGLGHESMLALRDRLRCQHWRGCELRLPIATYPHGTPLIGYIGQGMLVAIICARCRHRVTASPEAVIGRLAAAGRGSGATGILDLAGLVRGPCRGCGSRGPFSVKMARTSS